MKESNGIKENKKKLAKFALEFNAKAEEIAIKDRMVLTHHDRVIHIWKRTVTQGQNIFVEWRSSLHWTTVMEVSVRGNDIDLSYGSGGTLDADPAVLAKAMSIMFDQAQKVIKAHQQ